MKDIIISFSIATFILVGIMFYVNLRVNEINDSREIYKIEQRIKNINGELEITTTMDYRGHKDFRSDIYFNTIIINDNGNIDREMRDEKIKAESFKSIYNDILNKETDEQE